MSPELEFSHSSGLQAAVPPAIPIGYQEEGNRLNSGDT